MIMQFAKIVGLPKNIRDIGSKESEIKKCWSPRRSVNPDSGRVIVVIMMKGIWVIILLNEN